MLVTVIACTSGSATIEETLRSLTECELPSDYRGTLIVENGGPSTLEPVVNSFKSTLYTNYFHVREPGKSNALNIALRSLDDELVFFSDDDAHFDREVLCAYGQAGDEYGPGHFFGGPFDVDQETPPPEWLHSYLPPSAKGFQYEDCDDLDDTFTGFLGFNWAAFASDIKAAGGFDTLKGPGSATGSTGQETDMQKRLVDHGIVPTFVESARVTHFVPRDSCSPQWALHRSYRNGVKDGLNYAERFAKQVSVLPLWLIKANIKYAVKVGLHLFNESQRFDSSFWLHYHLGFLKGIWAGKQ